MSRSQRNRKQPAAAAPVRRRARDDVPTGWDLAKNRPGSSAYAAAREHATWWRRIGRAMGFRTKDQAWRIGGEGEELVAGTLRWARLFGWRVLHAVPVGDRGADIDHVLIGPAGVITLNTKHHRGQRVRVKPDVVFVGKTAKKGNQGARFPLTVVDVDQDGPRPMVEGIRSVTISNAQLPLTLEQCLELGLPPGDYTIAGTVYGGDGRPVLLPEVQTLKVPARWLWPLEADRPPTHRDAAGSLW